MDNLAARIFHGDLNPADLAQALLAEFNRGNLRAQVLGQSDKLAVQIGSRPDAISGGQTALTVTLQKAADGVMVQLGEQEWMGTAASIGWTAFAALRNPWTLINRLDDLAQDVENIQLSERIWNVIAQAARAAGASHQLSERLSRLACEYCGTANPVGESACIACGAPLGNLQPSTCRNCGFVVKPDEIKCPNCGQPL
ncbi:MAG TPA: zinc ribbon domain-containing protein [Anaerolineales bacterium]|jgi:RNA polymerase subunit RPABC4/transcription elongation factor Spt4|nr:zinc ribbon domain-containing protein [Anaerolineales bacterium]